MQYYYDRETLGIDDILKLTAGGVHDGNALIKNGITWKRQNKVNVAKQLNNFIDCIESSDFSSEINKQFRRHMVDLANPKVGNLLPSKIYFEHLIADED